MKICHLADSHLGSGESFRRRGKSGLTVRQEDMIRSFEEAVTRIIAIKPDLCLHAGDLFHQVRPLNSILAAAARQLHRLTEEHGIPTVVINGNHDAPKQPHVGAPLEVYPKLNNLYVAAEGRLQTFRIGAVAVHALPHILTTTGLKEQVAGYQPDPDAEYNILVAHGVAAGMPEFSMADLGEMELPLDFLNRFDYAALGHFHNFCKVADRAWYAGSTERLSQSERDSAKGFALVDLNPLKVELVEVPTREMVDLRIVDAKGQRGDQVAQAIKEQIAALGASDKIVRVTVENVTAETLKTLPSEDIAGLRDGTFALDVRFTRETTDERTERFGRSAIGRLDKSFVEFLESEDLAGFDKDRLLKAALRYLEAEE
jgi:DNA repair exonuclease SbcCD nuclease subunit